MIRRMCPRFSGNGDECRPVRRNEDGDQSYSMSTQASPPPELRAWEMSCHGHPLPDKGISALFLPPSQIGEFLSATVRSV